MKDPVRMFSKPENLVMNTFAGTLSTTQACLLLSKHRRLLVCEENVGPVKIPTARNMEVSACQLPNEKSNLKGNE